MSFSGSASSGPRCHFMPLASIGRLMEAARRHDYAVGYFESWNLESLQGVIDAAEQTRSPVIIGFNGEFLGRRAGATLEDVDLYGAVGKAIAAKASVPCGFIFNECPEDSWVERAITSGFNLVMLADPSAARLDYTRRVQRLATLAHANGIAIEGEIDELPCGAEDGVVSDPKVAVDFVAATGVDLLAISIGNEHIKLRGRASLDLKRLGAIRKVLDIPLVLHGGTGIEDGSLKEAIRLGVRKVNFGTYLKQKYLLALRTALTSDESNPHALLGNGSETDIMVIGRNAIRNAVLERIELLGCCGRA
jgi:fructose/tagatose bisphosphate aldolase